MDDLGSQKEEVVKLRATITQQAQELERVKAGLAAMTQNRDEWKKQSELDRAGNIMAGVNKCTHSTYWITAYGNCMACRAEAAEQQLAAMTRERDEWQVQYTEAKKIQWGVETGEFWFWNDDEQDHIDSLICPVVVRPEKVKEWKQQLAASQARCREMEQERDDTKLDWKHMVYKRDQLSLENSKLTDQLAQLQATLAARDFQWSDELAKVLPGLSFMSFVGPESTARWVGQQLAARVASYDRMRDNWTAAVQEAGRLQLTWTTARPTVAGLWLWRATPSKDAETATIRENDLSGWCVHQGYTLQIDRMGGEWAGPIQLPMEAQQAAGDSPDR